MGRIRVGAIRMIHHHAAASIISSSQRRLFSGAGREISTITNMNNNMCMSEIKQLLASRRRWYGSKTIVEVEEQAIPGMNRIRPYLRSGLNTNDESNANTAENNRVGGSQFSNQEFVLSFLGTGGGAPTRNRLGSCTALRLGGQTFLFDVTEGSLRQLEFSRIMPSTITKIFITHLHGDHLFGLVPIILGIMVSHKVAMSNPTKRNRRLITTTTTIGGEQHVHVNKSKVTLEIYGPPGLYNYINMVLALSCSKINYLNVHVIELVGGRMERGPGRDRGGAWQRGTRNVFLSHYPEVESPYITRKYLQKNSDNIWVIDEPEPITEKSLDVFMMSTLSSETSTTHGFNRLPNDVNLGTGRRLHIKAAEIDHLYGVQTFGYMVEEQPPPGNIDQEKAKACGIKPGKKYGLLKCGLSVSNDDGTRIVQPEEVLIETFRPRKVAILSDHRLVFREMAQLCRNADLLVHEATLSKEDGLEKIKMRGHNTAYNAGVFGRQMGCKVVVLNHFGSVSCGRAYVNKMIAEAREGNENVSQIVASHDFLEIWIPRGGFDFQPTSLKLSKSVTPAIATTDLLDEEMNDSSVAAANVSLDPVIANTDLTDDKIGSSTATASDLSDVKSKKKIDCAE
jgi:ribonuclease Z